MDSPGPLAVGSRTDVVLRDSARDRDVTATYWYPIAGKNAGREQAREGAALIGGEQRFPLLVLIHGIESNAPATWPYLAPHLASHGYIVVAPSTGSTAATAADIANHPGDVSFLIDTVTAASPGANMFANRIDESRIGLGGFSFGAGATYLLSYAPATRDPRLKAVILMAGGITEPAPVNPDVSLLAVFGTEDILIPYELGLNIYEAANAPKYLVTLHGGGHVGFTSASEFNIGATMELDRQRALTRLSVFAFLTAVFDPLEVNRSAAQAFLVNSLPGMNADVDVFADLGRE